MQGPPSFAPTAPWTHRWIVRVGNRQLLRGGKIYTAPWLFIPLKQPAVAKVPSLCALKNRFRYRSCNGD